MARGGAREQGRAASRLAAHPGHGIDPRAVGTVRPLHQVGEEHAEGRGDAVEGGQADIHVAAFDPHQHPPADARGAGQGLLAEARRTAQAADILGNVLEDVGAFIRFGQHIAHTLFFAHYVAH
ncbi:hypothetical protein D3C84_789220 [compost metagenome]